MQSASASRPPSSRIAALHARAVAEADEMVRRSLADPAVLARKAASVSAWSAAEHLEHLQLTGQMMLQSIEDALRTPPRDAEKRPIFLAYVVLWTGYIPRGKGQAPPEFLPRPGMGLEAIRADLRRFREDLGRLALRLGEVARATGRARHPFFGFVTARQWLRMLEVHQRHHLKILAELEGRA